ncbi:MAG: chorismate synthase [Clostridia bacterium]|nr:chorismate synthase [Clostridia bacterium]
MNVFTYTGNRIKVEVEGESHSERISARLSGDLELINSIEIDERELQAFLDRRAPGKNAWSTPRKEPDKVIISRPSIENALEGMSNDSTEGVIEGTIINTNTKPHDYSGLLRCPRPSHADYTAGLKYGDGYVSSGGGSFSGRMTAPLCIAGGIAIQQLQKCGIRIFSHIKSIGDISDINYSEAVRFEDTTADRYIGYLKEVASKDFPTVSDESAEKMINLIREASADGDSVGGIIETVVTGMPGGIGGPLFEGIEGKIANLMFAVPAVKGIEFGNGFDATELRGSQNNDAFEIRDGKVKMRTNNSGGILGGISVGDAAPIVFATAFKPTPSIAKEQDTVDLVDRSNTKIEIKGRHDPCIVPRAVPVTEAVTALAIWDLILSK